MEPIKAGFAKKDLTPQEMMMMDGFVDRVRPSEGVHDRLFARASVLTDGVSSVALVSCDVCWFTEATLRDVRKEAAAEGIDQLMLAATHTHSGPQMSDFLAEPTEASAEYARALPRLIGDAVRSAHQALGPVRMRLTKSKSASSFNRRGSDGEVDQEVI